MNQFIYSVGELVVGGALLIAILYIIAISPLLRTMILACLLLWAFIGFPMVTWLLMSKTIAGGQPIVALLQLILCSAFLGWPTALFVIKRKSLIRYFSSRASYFPIRLSDAF